MNADFLFNYLAKGMVNDGEYNSPSSKKQQVAQLVISQWGAFAVDSAPARVSCRCPGGTPKREEEETWSTGRGGGGGIRGWVVIFFFFFVSSTGSESCCRGI
jgi:hypothetical protein